MAGTSPKGHRHEVRLIGGRWKRSKLPVADFPGLRPTPDRVRETLFNWLGQDLSGWRCLDAFAGSGALGLEAASRGARNVWLVERDPVLAASLRSVVQRLKADSVEVVCDDALSVMRRGPPGAYDLVLLDPPYGSGLVESALASATALVETGGYAYAEDSRMLSAPAGWSIIRQGRAGAVFFHLLRRD
jgi:16S rRNA (guanine(966)-N(2))-methyltransferase RsmD